MVEVGFGLAGESWGRRKMLGVASAVLFDFLDRCQRVADDAFPEADGLKGSLLFQTFQSGDRA